MGEKNEIEQSDYVSGWIDEAMPHLERIEDGLSFGGKRTTILYVAEQLAMGVTITNAFGRNKPANVASKKSHYKWRVSDPIYREVSEAVIRIAQRHFDRIGMDMVQRAASLLMHASPIVTKALVELALNPHTTDRVKLDTIKEILDRAGEETTSKVVHSAPQSINVSMVDVGMLPVTLREQILGYLESEDE